MIHINTSRSGSEGLVIEVLISNDTGVSAIEYVYVCPNLDS